LYGLDSPTQWQKDHDGGGADHAPHSHSFNLAWVDPTSKVDAKGTVVTDPTKWTIVQNNVEIAQDIAHETGHTFGLTHVDSGTTGEMMSYTAANTRFAKIAFQITTLDNSGTAVKNNDYGLQPIWGGSTITTQNSFTFLQAELGARPDNGTAHVAHQGSVDPTAYVAPTGLPSDTPLQGVITRPGDYDVYSYVAGDGQNLISLRATGADGAAVLDPQLLIYDSQGNLVLLSQNMVAGQAYSIVVGAVDGASVGSYQLNALHIPNVPILEGPVGPEDPVTAVPGGTGAPVMSSPWLDAGVWSVLSNPAIDFGQFLVQSAGQPAGSVTPQSNVVPGIDPSAYLGQSQMLTQTFSLPYADILGLQQPWAEGSTSYSPTMGLDSNLAASMALPASSLTQVGGYFLL
jgi:hypothetical protein